MNKVQVSLNASIQKNADVKDGTTVRLPTK